MIKDTLRKLKTVNQPGCVTILLETHRTYPDNKQDPILLKNLLHEVEERLQQEGLPDEQVRQTLANLDKVQATINHDYNLDGLAIFANAEMGIAERLPTGVDSRVVVDDTFATRDLIRSMHQVDYYYIMALSEQEARLYYAYQDTPPVEVTLEGFPWKAERHEADAAKMAQANTEDRYVREFFNRVDKAWWPIYQNQPGPLVLATVEENIPRFTAVSDHETLLIGNLKGNWEQPNLAAMAKGAWEVVCAYEAKAQEEVQSILNQAESKHKLVAGINEIWSLIQSGRGDQLIVEKGYFQPAEIVNEHVVLIDDAKKPGAIDDLVDELIEQQLMFKGRVLFVEDGTLENYGRIALTLRY